MQWFIPAPAAETDTSLILVGALLLMGATFLLIGVALQKKVFSSLPVWLGVVALVVFAALLFSPIPIANMWITAKQEESQEAVLAAAEESAAKLSALMETHYGGTVNDQQQLVEQLKGKKQPPQQITNIAMVFPNHGETECTLEINGEAVTPQCVKNFPPKQ